MGWAAEFATSVKNGRRPSPKAARSVLDGGEHGATLGQAGAASRAVNPSVRPGPDTRRQAWPRPISHLHHPGRPPLAQANRPRKLVCGGTIRFRAMMPQCAGPGWGAWRSGTNLDGGVFQP